MDSIAILEQHCAARALVNDPLMTGADDRPDELTNVVSLDAARTRRATARLHRPGSGPHAA